MGLRPAPTGRFRNSVIMSSVAPEEVSMSIVFSDTGLSPIWGSGYFLPRRSRRSQRKNSKISVYSVRSVVNQKRDLKKAKLQSNSDLRTSTAIHCGHGSDSVCHPNRPCGVTIIAWLSIHITKPSGPRGGVAQSRIVCSSTRKIAAVHPTRSGRCAAGHIRFDQRLADTDGSLPNRPQGR